MQLHAAYIAASMTLYARCISHFKIHRAKEMRAHTYAHARAKSVLAGAKTGGVHTVCTMVPRARPCLGNSMHLSFMRCIVGTGYYYTVEWLFIGHSGFKRVAEA